MTNHVIKFRAWDKSIQRMAFHFSLEAALLGLRLETNEVNDLIFMQFTGLLDKNGKEIYEGDIVKGGWPKVAVVEWLESRSGFVRSVSVHETKIPLGIELPSDLEIIGNVMENPDLLK